MSNKTQNIAKVECCSDSGHSHDDHGHSHDIEKVDFQLFLPAIISFVLLISALTIDYVVKPVWFNSIFRLFFYMAAFIPVGFPVIKDAIRSIRYSDFFSEFLLMSIATIGAFSIGEYPEAVAVMLFYAIGEVFQSIAVMRAQNNIQELLDQRPDEVTIIENGKTKTIHAEDAKIGDVIQLKPGEKLGLDGLLLSPQASFNTSALTGESVPDTKREGEEVLAGMINLNEVCQVKVVRSYENSQLSRILHLVRDASSRKAPSELFISKFAKVYTPIVVFLAFAICLLPYFFVTDYEFKNWLYRALIFLVISCPCALVISIPLGYFGGIGAASRNGILVKGGNFLDGMASINHVVMDKTGTLTKGVFKVQEVHFDKAFNHKEILDLVNLIESKSTHPIATAIHEYVGEINHHLALENIEEIAGNGLVGKYDGKTLLVGNFKLMEKFNLKFDARLKDIPFTTIAVGFNNQFVGYITIADEIKPESKPTIDALKSINIKPVMFSGDKDNVVQAVAKELGIDKGFGDLLPQDKVNRVLELKQSGDTVAFVGDGLNDAPVLAISDVGIAMGGLGSDVAIETADIVIQDDNITKVPMAIKIGKKTKRIVWQNVFFAFGVKAIVLIMGAGGIATMWEAVFADVGVALLAILNAARILKMDFSK